MSALIPVYLHMFSCLVFVPAVSEEKLPKLESGFFLILKKK